MDLSRLTLGSKLVLGLGVLMLIDSFLHWQEVSLGPISAGVSMWHGWGVLVGLLLLAILIWGVAQLGGIKIALGPLSPSMVTTALAVLLVLFTLIKVLVNDYVAVWAWIGLVLSAGIAAGAWLNMQSAGESLADLKSSVAAAASTATAAAKSASASTHDGSSAPAPPSAPAVAETPPEGSGSDEEPA